MFKLKERGKKPKKKQTKKNPVNYCNVYIFLNIPL